MSRTLFGIAILYFVGSTSAVSSFLPRLFPVKHRFEASTVKPIENIPLNTYEYHIIPNNDISVSEYFIPKQPSISDSLTRPVTALTGAATSVLTFTSWMVSSSLLVLLGMALVLGFCAFTPFCTLTIEKPLTRELRTVTNNIPYIDGIENLLKGALNKYQDMQF